VWADGEQEGPLSTSDPQSTLIVERDRAMALVTLNRPDRMNAFNAQMTSELVQTLGELDDDDEVRAIVVTGAGRAFSAGADMSGGLTPGTPAGGSTQAPSGPPPFKPWELRTPIIAAINGAAVGMGITYPLMWDIRIAAQDAKIGLVFTRRGLVPEGNALWLLSRLIGGAAALELLLTGRTITGAEAAGLGLVNRAVPREDVVATAVDLAVDLAANTSPAAVAVTKRLFYKYLEDTNRWGARAEELEYFRWAGSQPDAGEGVRAFLEKRPPEWTGVSREHLPEGLW
jgi:enoyl-CoA hydratase/carnithine racemase